MQNTPPANSFSDETIETFAELAEFTRPKCGACRLPHSCCTAEQCEATRTMAQEIFGTDLQDAPDAGRLPFLGSSGCVVPAHLRPLCAVHVCGAHLSDPEWSKTYWDLRNRASNLLLEDFPL